MGCSNLWGVSVAAKNRVFANGSFGNDGDPVPDPGQTVLVFASPTRLDPMNFKAFRWDYAERFAETGSVDAVLFVAGGLRGVIVLESSSGAESLTAVSKYWSHLRGTAHDFEKYAGFLTCIQTSAVERVRQDARCDLRLLIRFADKPTLRDLRQKGLLNEEGRAYLEKILAWKEKGEPKNVRDLTPKATDMAAWMQALREGTDSTRLHALAEMIIPERRSWLEKNSDSWREDVANLMSNRNSAVKGLSAILLSHVGDARAVHVLLEMLRNEDVYCRRAAWKELEARCGASVSFDPDALPAAREESVRNVENWFKEHGRQ